MIHVTETLIALVLLAIVLIFIVVALPMVYLKEHVIDKIFRLCSSEG